MFPGSRRLDTVHARIVAYARLGKILLRQGDVHEAFRAVIGALEVNVGEPRAHQALQALLTKHVDELRGELRDEMQALRRRLQEAIDADDENPVVKATLELIPE